MEKKIGKITYVEIDETRIKTVIDIYYHWKTLDTEIRTLSGSRGVNFPSELSEPIVAYALGYYVNKKDSGDAVDLTNPKKIKKIEIKGSGSNSKDLSSFSPKEEYDELIFAKVDKVNDKVNIYKTGMSSKDIQKIKVNKSKTLKQHQKEGKRPRFSIEEKIIGPKKLKPFAVFDIRNKKVTT